MSDLKTLILLDQIVEASDRLAVLTAESSLQAIEVDWRTYDAICLGLIRIGESVNALPESAKDRLTAVNWRDVVALRNRIAHGYPTLTKARIWEIAEGDVPVLAQVVRRLRSELEKS